MTAADQSIGAAQQSIRERVTAAGPGLGRLRPAGIAAVLVGAVLWPVAAPLLGTGAAVGVATGVLGLLSGPGQAAITELLKRVSQPARPPPDGDTRVAFEQALERRISGDGPLREDVGRLLRAVDGVNVALAASPDDARRSLARGLAELGETWTEFAWMLADVQARQYESLALQRQQLDLQREQLVKLNRALAGRERVRAPARPARERRAAPAEAIEPYKGLNRYEADDAELFFGRELLRAELLARVVESRLLALIGDSGSGKSSLLRAGLVRAVWDGAVPGGTGWPVVLMSPGARPLDELAVRVARLTHMTPAGLVADMSEAPAALALAAREALLDAPQGSRLLLVVDQLEELYTMGADEATRRVFLDALLAAVRDPGGAATVVLAIRSDFLGALAEHPGLPEALRDNQVLVGPLSADDLARVIRGPAEHARLRVEPELVELVVDDARDATGALPLVSHALLETFKRREGRTLRARDYVEAGRLRGAIAQSADAAIDALAPAEREIARRVFLRLTSLGEGTEDTRRRASLDELVEGPAQAPAVQRVVDALVRAHLLVSGERGIDVTHEALIRHWPTLRRWLDEDREGLRLHRRLSAAAQEWSGLGREPGALYRGARLAAAVEWAAGHRGDLNPLERSFLEASRRAERDDLDAARRRTRRLRVLVASLVVLVVVAGVAAVQARQASRRADREATAADRAAAQADSRRIADEAISTRAGPGDLRRLLALDAYARARTPEAHAALVSTLEQAPRLRATVRGRFARLAFTPDGSLVTGGADGTLAIWDASGARMRSRFAASDGESQGLSLSADGRWLVAAWPHRLQTWDLSGDGAPRLRAEVAVRTLDVAVGGSLIATGGPDGDVRLWRLPSLRPVRRLAGQRGNVTAVAISPDAAHVVASGDAGGGDVVWDTATGTRQRRLRSGLTIGWDLAFLPGTSTVAVGRADGLWFWDAASGARLAHIGIGGAALAIAVDRAGDRAAIAGADDAVRIVATPRLKAVGRPLLAHARAVTAVALSPDGAIAASSDGVTLRFWAVGDIDPGRRVHGDVTSIALSADGERAALATAPDGALWLRDRRGLHLIAPRGVSGVAFGADGERLVGVGWGRAEVWDLAGRATPSTAIPAYGVSATAALDRDGRVLAWAPFAGEGDRVHLVDLHSGKAATLPQSDQTVRVLAFSPDAGRVASGGEDGALNVWDVARRRRLLRTVVGRDTPVGSVAFSPDGRTVAAGAGDGGITLVDLTHRRGHVRLDNGGDPVRGLAFSRDGRSLAAAGSTSVRLWDVDRREAVGELRSAAQALTFTPEGDLAGVGAAGRIERWPALLTSMDVGAWRDRICRMVGGDLSPSDRRRWRLGRADLPRCSRQARAGGTRATR